MECPNCGFMMDAFTQTCPRCARLGATAARPQARRAAARRNPLPAILIILLLLAVAGAGIWGYGYLNSVPNATRVECKALHMSIMVPKDWQIDNMDGSADPTVMNIWAVNADTYDDAKKHGDTRGGLKGMRLDVYPFDRYNQDKAQMTTEQLLETMIISHIEQSESKLTILKRGTLGRFSWVMTKTPPATFDKEGRIIKSYITRSDKYIYRLSLNASTAEFPANERLYDGIARSLQAP